MKEILNTLCCNRLMLISSMFDNIVALKIVALMVLGASGLAPTVAQNVYSIEPFPADVDFAQPVLKKKIAPRYPQKGARDGTAGYVEISLMVDQQGEPYELIVERSSHAMFEGPSLVAVEEFVFTPASIDQKSVDGRVSVAVRFEMEGQYTSIARSHIKQLQKINDRIANNPADQQEIESLIAKVEKLVNDKRITWCGRAHAYFAMQQLTNITGEADKELSALQFLQGVDMRSDVIGEALYEETFSCFSESMDRDIDVVLVSLLFEQGDAASAFREIAHYDKPNMQTLKESLINSLDPYYLQLEQPAEINSSHTVSTRGYTLIEVMGRNLAIQNIGGTLESAKLRCDAGFMQVEFAESTEIEIPPAFGRCQVQVIGEAGTQFELNEQR